MLKNTDLKRMWSLSYPAHADVLISHLECVEKQK